MDYNIISHLKRIQALLSIYKALIVSKDFRDAFVQTLLNPETYEILVVEKHLTKPTVAKADEVTFTEEGLMLGTEDHNRPLYMEDFINCVRLKRILIDPEFVVNLLSIRALKRLGHSKEDLQHKNFTIQRFNRQVTRP